MTFSASNYARNYSKIVKYCKFPDHSKFETHFSSISLPIFLFSSFSFSPANSFFFHEFAFFLLNTRFSSISLFMYGGHSACFFVLRISHFLSISLSLSPYKLGVKFFLNFFGPHFSSLSFLFLFTLYGFSKFYPFQNPLYCRFQNFTHFSSISLLIFPLISSLICPFSVFRTCKPLLSFSFSKFHSLFFHIFAHMLALNSQLPRITSYFSKFPSFFFHIFAHLASFSPLNLYRCFR